MFGGSASFSSLLECAVELFRVAVRCFFPRLSQFTRFCGNGEVEVHRALADGVLRGTSCFAACGGSVFKTVGFHDCCPKDEICEVNPSG